MFTGYIYCIVNTINGKKYVGQTIRSVASRFREHMSPKSQCPKMRNAVQHYGEAAFQYTILETFHETTREELANKLNDAERHYITKYNCITEGYNCAQGGQGASIGWSEEARKRISKEGGPFYGKHHTEE